MAKASASTLPKKIHLALQGGGPRGAYQAAELMAMLDDPAIELGYISGTSAGAINAFLLATGLAQGILRAPDDPAVWRECAKARLRDFWLNLSAEQYMQDVQPDYAGASAAMMGDLARNPALAFSPAYWFGATQRSITLRHPLMVMLSRFVKPQEIQLLNRGHAGLPKLLIDVSDMEGKQQVIFRAPHISIEVIAASGGIHGLTGEVMLTLPDGQQRRCGDGAFFGSNPPIKAIYQAVLEDRACAGGKAKDEPITIVASMLNALAPHDLAAAEAAARPLLSSSLHAHARWQAKMNSQALDEIAQVEALAAESRARVDLHVVVAHAELGPIEKRMIADPAEIRAALQCGDTEWHSFMRSHAHLLGVRSSYTADAAELTGGLQGEAAHARLRRSAARRADTAANS